MPSQISISGNPQSVGQVLLNVVRNAFDAMEGQRNGRVDIEARVRHPKGRSASAPIATICIRDNGPGVPVHLRDRIFEEGVSSKAQHDGLGLGLAISRDIMVALGGRLELLPSRQGAAFLIEVPVARTPEGTPSMERTDL
jgi:two-component system C4-dicarboxylate transport sensor histidine kinase DctB